VWHLGRPPQFRSNEIYFGNANPATSANPTRYEGSFQQMSAKHGTHSRYSQGCRCDACAEGHRLTARDYAQRKNAGQVRPRVQLVKSSPPDSGVTPEPGPVEAATQQEINAMPAQTRPGLVAIALAMARILDSSRAASAQPAAAKVLVSVLDTLHRGSAQGRRGNLAVVKSMTTTTPAG
jgi:hypothetical protein